MGFRSRAIVGTPLAVICSRLRRGPFGVRGDAQGVVAADKKRELWVTNSAKCLASEPGSVRRDQRVTVPLTAVIDGRSLKVQEWSFGGFRLSDPGDEMQPGKEFSGQLMLRYRSSTLKLEIRYRVVWRHQADVGCQFVDLPRSVRLALRHLLRNVTEGRLYDVETAPVPDEAPEPREPSGESSEVEDEAHFEVDRQRRPRGGHPYLAAGVVVALVSLLLLSRDMAFTDSAVGEVNPGPAAEQGLLLSEPISPASTSLEQDSGPTGQPGATQEAPSVPSEGAPPTTDEQGDEPVSTVPEEEEPCRPLEALDDDCIAGSSTRTKAHR